jgi:dienelactone hydrolase
MTGRRTVVALTLTLLVLSALVLGACASAKPVTTMAHAPKGRVEFPTLTLSASEFWSGVKTGQPVTISGELMLPKGDGRVPVVVLSHGGGGVTSTEEHWSAELRSLGVAVFVVDSFTGRGIKQFPPETELSRAGQVYDVYQALALLATHPRIDAGRIALMGASRGGGLTILAAMTRSLKAQAPGTLEFCAYLALYPSISATFDYGQLANRPIRLFTGTLDEAIPITTVRGFAEKQRVAGTDVKLFEYEGAHHSFDNPDLRTPFIVRGAAIPFTVAHHPQAHAKIKKDMKDTLAEVCGKQ